MIYQVTYILFLIGHLCLFSFPIFNSSIFFPSYFQLVNLFFPDKEESIIVAVAKLRGLFCSFFSYGTKIATLKKLGAKIAIKPILK